MFCECGTGSFKHVDEDPAEDVGCTGGGGSPRDNKQQQGRRKHGGGKVNPYAERGLDRFSVVLSELETRRAKILRRVGSDDTGLVLVRFAVQSNGDWTPVVVKLPEPPPPKSKKAAAATKKPARATAAPLRPPPPAPAASSPRSPPPDHPTASPREREGASSATAKVVAARVPVRKASFSWGRRMRRPSCYLPSVIVLTLVSLAVFGRVFGICLASIWWYVLPTLGGGSCYDDGARRNPAGMRMSSMEKKKVVSPPLPHPHGKNGSTSSGVYEVVRSPKGKRG